jgi:hypothetical protein
LRKSITMIIARDALKYSTGSESSRLKEDMENLLEEEYAEIRTANCHEQLFKVVLLNFDHNFGNQPLRLRPVLVEEYLSD